MLSSPGPWETGKESAPQYPKRDGDDRAVTGGLLIRSSEAPHEGRKSHRRHDPSQNEKPNAKGVPPLRSE